jgi:hypothetical protein
MGQGYHLLIDAISGKGLDNWQALHVESGIYSGPAPENKPIRVDDWHGGQKS